MVQQPTGLLPFIWYPLHSWGTGLLGLGAVRDLKIREPPLLACSAPQDKSVQTPGPKRRKSIWQIKKLRPREGKGLL